MTNVTLLLPRMRMTDVLRVNVLGCEARIYFSRSPIEAYVAESGGKVVDDPPPFLVPCRNGVLLVFSLVHGPQDIRGHYAVLPIPSAEQTQLRAVWESSSRELTVEQVLDSYGFRARAQADGVH